MALLCWPASGSFEQDGRTRHTHTNGLHGDDGRDDDNAVMVMVMRTTVSGILGRRRWTGRDGLSARRIVEKGPAWVVAWHGVAVDWQHR